MDNFSSIRCVVFDLDDTLWPCEPVIVNAEIALYEWFKEHYPRISNQYSLEDVRKQRTNFALRNPHIAHDVTALRKQSLLELAQEFDYPMGLASDGLALFRKHRNKVSLFDDALPTISKLREHFSTGVITNGNADLNAIGLSEYFNFIVTAEEAGAAKPDKTIFELAQKKINLSSHELLYVGDHPIIDVLGSNSSGWKSLWFNPYSEPWMEDVKPDAEIQSLSEIPSLLLCI
ncbi:MAG: HAD family hydrolase [Gammaproteobacteria bacterium]